MTIIELANKILNRVYTKDENDSKNKTRYFLTEDLSKIISEDIEEANVVSFKSKITEGTIMTIEVEDAEYNVDVKKTDSMVSIGVTGNKPECPEFTIVLLGTKVINWIKTGSEELNQSIVFEGKRTPQAAFESRSIDGAVVNYGRISDMGASLGSKMMFLYDTLDPETNEPVPDESSLLQRIADFVKNVKNPDSTMVDITVSETAGPMYEYADAVFDRMHDCFAKVNEQKAKIAPKEKGLKKE
jgi:hypothetical protein